MIDPPHVIGWLPGYDPNGDSRLEFGGGTWRYDLVPRGLSETGVNAQLRLVGGAPVRGIALALLERLHAAAAAQGRAGSVIEIQALRALAEENQRRAAVGLPPKTRRRRRTTLTALAAPGALSASQPDPGRTSPPHGMSDPNPKIGASPASSSPSLQLAVSPSRTAGASCLSRSADRAWLLLGGQAAAATATSPVAG